MTRGTPISGNLQLMFCMFCGNRSAAQPDPTPQIFIGVITDLSMHNASLQPPKGAPEIAAEWKC